MAKVTKAKTHPKMAKGKLSEIRHQPGMSGAFKHKSASYAGPKHTYPIGDKKHARNALARAHFAKNPEAIREAVHRRYPEIGKKKKK